MAGGKGGNKVGRVGRFFNCGLTLLPLVENVVAGVDKVAALDAKDLVVVVSVVVLMKEVIRSLAPEGRGGRAVGTEI